MTTPQERALIPIPLVLAKQIDAIAGTRKRSAFIVDMLETELHRQRLLKALDDASGCWRDENHPELNKGGSVWVSKQRLESGKRNKMLEKQRKS